MDYLTLKKHCDELERELVDKPLITRAFSIPGQGFCLRLKRKNAEEYFIFQLEQAIQGCRLSTEAQEIENSPLFVRQLNRLLSDGRIIAVSLFADETRLKFDRVVKIHIAVVDRYFGNRSDYFLICEFTGRIANIFLTDSRLVIIDRFTQTANNETGQPYRLPDSDYQVNPFTANKEELEQVFNTDPSSWIDKIGGFSPLLAKELAFRTSREKSASALAATLLELVKESELSDKTRVAVRDNKLKALCCFYPSFVKDSAVFEFKRVGDALEYVEKEIYGKKRFKIKQQKVLNYFKKEHKSCRQLIEKQHKLLEKYASAEELVKKGNLLVANIYRIPERSKFAEVEDWETGEKIKLNLDPEKSLAAQAQKFFDRAKKYKRGVLKVKNRIESLEADLCWLDEQVWLTENAEKEADLPEVGRKKIQKQQKSNNKSARKRRKHLFKPVLVTNNCSYYVGRNGRQNEIITFEIAGKKDRWFHANDVPGAHVILKKNQGEIEDIDVERGAILAAWFSFARQSSKVAVDTTEVMRVKKIPGGGPGRVSYTHQKTLFVNPGYATELFDLENDKHS
ncbi:MAG: Rqc2 family fibronectin-binding protein [Candidatus Rifleibacteriota bacterium]